MTRARTAQNVPICVAYTASHDVGKAAQNGGYRSSRRTRRNYIT